MGYISKSFVLDSTYVTQPYHINGEGGYNYNHWGIDLVGWNGNSTCLCTIKAHSDGIVEGIRNNCIGFESGSYGNYVLIKHSNGYRTLYAHGLYNSVKVNVGQKVKRGQEIMFMGNTGESYGGHLHFEIRTSNDYKINPEQYLYKDLPNSNKLDEDGLFGIKSITRLQNVLKIDYPYVIVDGYISGQYSDFFTYFPSFTSDSVLIESNGKGSQCIMAVQEVLKSYGLYDISIDGLAGKKTSKGLTQFLNLHGYKLKVDDVFDYTDAKAYQNFLNNIYY